MKRSKKITFFIVAALIFLLAAADLFGFNWYKGDLQQTVIKSVKEIRWGIDIKGGVETVFSPGDEVKLDKVTSKQMDAAKTVIENRLIGANITDYETYVDYDEKQIIVRFPWKSDEADFDANKAIEEIGQTAQLNFCYDEDETQVIMTGENIKSATAAVYQDSNNEYQPVVSFELDKEGTKLFREATEKQVEKGGVISIWLDGKKISAPKVSSVINEGKGQIEGLTEDESKVLANQINAGALPFSLQTNDSRTQIISPTLGESALSTMVMAGVIAFALIAVFVIIRYRLPGVVTVISLIGHVSLTLAAVSGFFGGFNSFTMTIPGLAGIILSIGMGVDANIISIERIKEELRLGKTIDGAVAAGYKNAFSAIFDGNITVVIVSLILMGSFGPADSFLSKILSKVLFMFSSTLSGSIYSFGYTLLIGVICNFVMGVFASRLMLKSLSRFEFLRKPSFFGVGGDK
jgi:protein-export membrane protein SecD